jgi:glycosyltransferase involved in cell wall biosynthesis
MVSHSLGGEAAPAGAVADYHATISSDRIAIVHDYVTQIGGAERVAGYIARMFPEARLLTSVYDACEVPLSVTGGRRWQTSFLQSLVPRTGLKPLLPLLPLAVSSLDASGCDTVISSSSAFGHHVSKPEGARHFCFCSTPPRFLWQPEDYFRGHEPLRLLLTPLLLALRRLDQRAAERVDVYIAVSRHIARRIRRVYARESVVIHPPIEVDSFQTSRERSGRFLVLSRLVHSKRVELVIEAANRYGLPLDVIGKGPELPRLQRLGGPTVRFHGWQPDHEVRRALAESAAVVQAGEEDFGLVMVEAQASGRPPVAFASGGAAEIIEDGVTGYLFDDQDPDAVAAAMQRALSGDLHTADLLASARRFDLPIFQRKLLDLIERAPVARPHVLPVVAG